MKIENVPFSVIDWSAIPATSHPGRVGTASWRTFELGNIRVRMVAYSPGYEADHWCSRGHVLLVLEGELTTEVKNGEIHTLHAGCSYHVADDAEPHRSRTGRGAKLFIVD